MCCSNAIEFYQIFQANSIFIRSILLVIFLMAACLAIPTPDAMTDPQPQRRFLFGGWNLFRPHHIFGYGGLYRPYYFWNFWTG